MPSCELLEICTFFKDHMARKPATADIYKRLYCQEDHQGCARYLVYRSLGKEKVPSDLFPTQSVRAKNLIKSEIMRMLESDMRRSSLADSGQGDEPVAAVKVQSCSEP